MSKLIIILMILTSSAWAKFPNIRFESLNGEFANNQGTAYAEAGKYEISDVKISHKHIEVKFNKKQKHLVIKDDNTTVELGFDFSFLNVFRAVNFSGVEITSNAKRFHTFLDMLNIYIDPNEYNVKEIDLVADVSKVDDIGDDVDVIDGFMINGDLNVGELSFGAIDRNRMFKDLLGENPNQEKIIRQMLSMTFNKRIPLVARNLRMVVRSETFSGSVKLDSWINLNLYLGGTVKHNTKDNLLIIDLLKAKLGYVSIRKWILNSVRNLNLESIEVQGSKVVIDLGKTIFVSRR